MSNLADLLADCTRRDIRFMFSADGIAFDAPKHALDDDLRGELVLHRDELLALLKRVAGVALTPAPEDTVWAACWSCALPELLPATEPPSKRAARRCRLTFGCPGNPVLEVTTRHALLDPRERDAVYIVLDAFPGATIDRDNPAPADDEPAPAPPGHVRFKDGLLYRLICPCGSHPHRGHVAKPVPEL